MITAGPEHAAAMAALHAAAFPHDPWPEDAFATLLQQPGVTGLIDPRGGFLLLRSVLDEAEILTIGAAARRQGIGRALLQAGIAVLQAQQVRTLYLEVAASNLAARGLYAAFGFARTGFRPNYYPDGADALILSLALPAAEQGQQPV